MRKNSFTMKVLKDWTRSPKLVDPPPLKIFKPQLDAAIRQPDLTGCDLSRGWSGWHPFQSSLLYNATTWRQTAFQEFQLINMISLVWDRSSQLVHDDAQILGEISFVSDKTHLLGKCNHTLHLYRTSIKGTWNTVNIIKDNNIHYQIIQVHLPTFPYSGPRPVRGADKRQGLFAQAYAMLWQLYIWSILRHRSGSYTVSTERRKRMPGTSALHTTPKNWIPNDFSPREYNPHDTNLSMLHYVATFPLLFIRADIMKKSRYVPTYLPLIKANFCLASRLIFSNLYKSAFSALLIHSSVTPSPFSTRALTSEKD